MRCSTPRIKFSGPRTQSENRRRPRDARARHHISVSIFVPGLAFSDLHGLRHRGKCTDQPSNLGRAERQNQPRVPFNCQEITLNRISAMFSGVREMAGIVDNQLLSSTVDVNVHGLIERPVHRSHVTRCRLKEPSSAQSAPLWEATLFLHTANAVCIPFRRTRQKNPMRNSSR